MNKSLPLLTPLSRVVTLKDVPVLIPNDGPGAFEIPPKEVRMLWKYLLDCNATGKQIGQMEQLFLLVAVQYNFERHCKNDYATMNSEVREIYTKSGKQLTVAGTRCEIAIRLSEALFKVGRRRPGNPANLDMLSSTEELIDQVLTYCWQKDNPLMQKRLYGMRGLARMLISLHSNLPAANRLIIQEYAKDDLKNARRLGNTGPEAATYLIDCLFHIYDLTLAKETLDEIAAIFDTLNPSEKDCRSIQHFIARYYFCCSFLDEKNNELIDNALIHADKSVALPELLSFDDAFVKLIRGQILIRKHLAAAGEAKKISEYLTEGIEDLRYAFDQFPEKFGKQASLVSALLYRANCMIALEEIEEAKNDLNFIIANGAYFAEIDQNLLIQAKTRLTNVELRLAVDSNSWPETKNLLKDVLKDREQIEASFIHIAHAVKALYTKTNESDPGILNDTLRLAAGFDRSVFVQARSIAIAESLHGNLLVISHKRKPDIKKLEEAYNRFQVAIEHLGDHFEPALYLLKAECALQLSKGVFEGRDKNRKWDRPARGGNRIF